VYILAYLSKGLKMGNGKEGGKKEKKEENQRFCNLSRCVEGRNSKGRRGGGRNQKPCNYIHPRKNINDKHLFSSHPDEERLITT